MAGNFYLDAGGDHRDTVLVAGSGRSGTTWLSSVVSRRMRSRFIFEPFPRKQYLRPDDDRPEFPDFARKVLCGKVSGGWPDRFNRRVISRRRLVKDIRANLMLGWMHARFPGMPVVLLLRHPHAVSRSRRRLGWKDRLPELLAQQHLLEDHLGPFERDLRAACASGDPLERDVHLWCVENFVPLRQIREGTLRAHVVFYEDLVAEPESEVRRVLDFIRRCPEVTTPPRIIACQHPEPEYDRKKADGILQTYGLSCLYGTRP